MKARIYTTDGKISPEVYEIQDGSGDRKGNMILSRGDKTIRIHPTRILQICKGLPVRKNNEILVVKCQECEQEIEVEIGQDEAECQNCNKSFNLNWGRVLAGPVIRSIPKEIVIKGKGKSKGKKIMKQYKIPVVIDLGFVKSVGELWTKAATFDHPEFDVKAHVLIITTEMPRKFCFNSYNGTWGRKSKEAELQAFAKNELLNNKKVGYHIKTEVDKERQRLERQGYKREE